MSTDVNIETKWFAHEAREKEGAAPLDPVTGWASQPVLVFRELKTYSAIYHIDDGMDELACILDDCAFEVDRDLGAHVSEVFIHGIFPGKGGGPLPIPKGYEEGGLWVRGQFDHTTRVAPTNLGRDRSPEIAALL